MIKDKEGNTLGEVTEGNTKKLRRAVNKDKDIINKYNNVKGYAELYKESKEEITNLVGFR